MENRGPMPLPDLRRIRHVIWDWNGTLLDDAWLCVEVMNGLLGPRGLPALDAARYQELFGFPVRAYYQRLGFDFAGEPFEAVGTEFIDDYQERQHECRLQEGAAQALAALARRDVACSVLSASEQSRLEEQAGRLGVLDRFVGLIGLDDHYAGSKLENGRSWMAKLGLEPDRVLLVGDTDHDCEVAREIGVPCVLVPSGHQSHARLQALGAPTVGSLAELAARWQESSPDAVHEKRNLKRKNAGERRP